ncbi:ATP-binding protein [Alteromonadaceae bacterium BrNp21-10]|nr:ATP-binding protein [Alteromonadaceae bacterium BrNp21-10]
MRILTLSLITAVLVATVGLGWLLDTLFYQFSEPSTSFSNENIMVLEEFGQDLATTINALPAPQQFVAHWQDNGRYLVQFMPMSNIQLPQPLIQQITLGEPLLLTNDNQISLYFYLPAHDSLLLLQPNFAIDNNSGQSLRLALTIVFYIALIMLIWLWASPLVSRLITLRNSAQQFGKGNLQQRIQVGSISYVKDLEIEFNNMAQRIENLVGDVKLISSAVSHDLRTPLARMRFGLDTLQEEADPLLQAQYIARLDNDIEEMTRLVEILLDYARLDQAMIKLDKKPIDIAPLLQRCITNKQHKNIIITFNAPHQPCIILGDENYLSILLNNLLQNAIQYGRQQVMVNIDNNSERLSIIIADDGDGFAGKHNDMLKPFVRGDANVQKIKGYGMGLAIVKRIVEWHHAELTIGKSNTLSGAEICVVFPAE